MFNTPALYAEHLSTLIDDEELVILAVRLKFPKYGHTVPKPAVACRMGEKEFSRTGRTKPISRFDGFMSTETTDIANANMLERGSTMLLAALWRDHSHNLETLSTQKDCNVVRL